MCDAVGTYSLGFLPNGNPAVGTAFDQWNGRGWEAASWPPFGPPGNEPLLSCAKNWCMAAYDLSTPPVTRSDVALVSIARWNGDRWVASPDLDIPTFFVPVTSGFGRNASPFEFGFACSSMAFCLASGVARNSGQICAAGESYVTLWNGTSWTVDIVGRETPQPNCH
jgi:hypothetical protein